MAESVRPFASSEAVAVTIPQLRVVSSTPPVAERYRTGGLLGEGGMATVLRAVDLSRSGTEVALKRLRALEDPERAAKARALFEREYHVMSQLSHPRAVRVLDYGVDAEGAYYTMELLDGCDLHAMTPVPWQRACSLIRDVCSVAALLHSRRLIHRDLSPRNIRCTGDGQAKLLDFGAVAPMGPVKQVVGTPPICAPEVLGLESLDPRADLYSLGATLYFALTGQHAYPARDFRQLRELWGHTPPPPSALVGEVPPALDVLVMSMLSLDPAARPASAAEVFDRLSAIADLPADEQLRVSRAYLHAANLVACDAPLARVRKKLARALDKHGSATLVLGAPGAGRSRILSAGLLDAKLLGFMTARMDAVDGRRGEYGGVQSLAAQLLESLPELSLEAARPRARLLAYAIPELCERLPGTELETFADPQQRRPRVQSALRDWICEIAAKRPLAIGVDDVDMIDEPSSAFAALLTGGIGQRSLALIATAQTAAGRATFGALKVLHDASTRLSLAPLEAQEMLELVRSVFGDVPHAQLLAHKLHIASQGNPRDAMHLAQHLVDRGAIRYAAGAWSLPSQIDDGDLPSSIAEAHRVRIAALSREAHALALAFALAPDVAVTFDEAQRLSGHEDASLLLRALDELLVSGMVTSSAQRFALAQRAFATMLRDDASGERSGEDRIALHRRLAAMFEARGDAVRSTQQLLRAGDIERGLTTLVEHARATLQLNLSNPDAYVQLVASLPEDWFETYRTAIELCAQRGRPRSDMYTLYSRVSGLVPGGHGDTEAVEALIALLKHESGLDIYEGLDGSLEPLARLGKSFELAAKRYAEMPENERTLEPVHALRPLARACIQAIGAVSSRLDLRLWEKLPSLKPFEPLSPALGVVDLLIQGNGKRITARFEEARAIYEALLARATQADRGGLDETHQRYVVTGVLCGLGFIEAPMGLQIALERARAIEGDPLHQVNALLITMLHHLWQGDVRSAERCKQQVELLRVQTSSRQFFEGGHLMAELCAYTASDDLVRTKQVTDMVAVMAAQLDGWAPILAFARGEYQRIRGDYEHALRELDGALAQVTPGRHQLWAEIAGAKLKVLDALGRYAEGRDAGQQLLAKARDAQLGFSMTHIELPLAALHAALGERAEAETLCDSTAARFEALGTTGLNLGLLFETRARVARRVGDHTAFGIMVARCGHIYLATGNRSLIAKHGRLLHEAHAASMTDARAVGPASVLTGPSAGAHMAAALSACPGPRERARLGLDLLVARSGVSGGFLFAIEAGGPVLVAQAGLGEAPSGLTLAVAEHLRGHLEDKQDTMSEGPSSPPSITATGDSSEETATLQGAPAFLQLAAEGRRLHPVLIAHRSRERYEVTGLAVLIVAGDRPFADPRDVAAHLSRAWFDSGDVTSISAWLSTMST